MAPLLSTTHTVICVDLRGYGQSGVPASDDNHYPYTKRAIGDELVALMETLGFSSFDLVGHDRGGRVAYRMALDHPQAIKSVAIFDVIPILEAWSRADARFAKTFWPWSLFSQKAPVPERYLLGAPDAVFDNPFGSGSFSAAIREEYARMYRDPERVHALCEEYRAAASLDPDHDAEDRRADHKISCPLLHLWGQGGPLDTLYQHDGGPLMIWKAWATNVQGRSMKGGHFFPEENPAETLEVLTKFLRGAQLDAA